MAVELSKMEDQHLLMLRGCSFLGCGSDIVHSIFANNGGCYYDFVLPLFHGRYIIQDARPSIVDNPLIIIFRRWLRHRQYHVCP